MTCAGCGFELSPDFAFCPRCGRPRAAQPSLATAEAPAEADRREVTVLFADLCGFTSLSERLDAEQVREFQAALFAALQTAITGYGGFVAKYIGDAVLALFGAPVAYEDAAERALDAALAMQAAGARLNGTWEARLGQSVALHIAVHTGPVVAGTLGPASRSGSGGSAYDVTGDTVNTASRLLGAAAPQTTLVSASTQALTQHRFAFGPAEAVALKGKAQPVIAYPLAGPLAAPQSARGLGRYGLASRLVGRTHELNQLRSAFARMEDGRAQVISVLGEAGSGKSRLLAEFFTGLQASGRLERMATRRTACSSLGEVPYGTFAALFREGYRIDLADSIDQARLKLAEGLRTLGASPEIGQALASVLGYLLGVEEANASVDLDPEQLRRQIVLAGRTLVERRLEQGPLLILVDDAHWADVASLDLIRDIVDQFADRPLMVVLSQRPERESLAAGRAEECVVRLSALSARDTDDLLREMFGPAQDAALAGLRDVIASRAGGNPLFVEEIVRSLVTSGVLVREDVRWHCTGSGDSLSIPATLHGLLLSRVDKLPAGARQVLQAAAVLGLAFEEPLLDAMVDEAETQLARLVAADFLRETGPGARGPRYQFSHALVQETVYGNLLQSRRGALHLRAAQALERMAGPSPSRLSDLEALGHHWSLTADKGRGGRYLMMAGDRARAVYANDDAIRHYERALRTFATCPDCDDDVRTVREWLGDLYALTGRPVDALASYQAVREQLEGAQQWASAARLYRKIGALHWEAGDRERAGDCFTAGLRQLDRADHPIERANLYQEIGRLAFRAGDNSAAIAWAERALGEITKGAVTKADESAGIDCQVQAYNTLGVALARQGQVKEAADRIAQSIALAETHHLLQATCRGYTNLGVLLSSLDPQRSIETCLKGLEIARKVGDLAFQSRLYANLAVAYCALTDRCEAEGLQAAEAAIDLDRRLGLIDHLAVPLIVLGQIRQCHGDHSLALESYREALALAEQIGEPQLLFPCYDGLATLHLDAGNGAMAEHYFAKAQEVCERAGVEPDALLVLPFLC
jgi:predicted ATPase/class 3 adenylate cyclase